MESTALATVLSTSRPQRPFHLHQHIPQTLNMMRSLIFAQALSIASASCTWKIVDIPRIRAEDFTVSAFWDDSISQSPVIITGIAEYWANSMDFFQFLRNECAAAALPVMSQANDPTLWANLEMKGDWRMDEFIDYVLTESEDDQQSKLYGFDLVINDQCPELLDHIQIPRYFNECVLQNDHVKGHFQRHRGNSHMFDWPTLMVGPAGSTSALHTDAQGFPFWMMLLEGKKHFRVLPYNSNYHLTGPRPTYEFQPPPSGKEFRGVVLEEYFAGGTFKFDGFNPDFAKYPELCEAELHEGILEKGEIIYVPNSAPHGVMNLEHTIAITSNFFNPQDRAQGEWLLKNCDAPDAMERGFSESVCDYMIGRVRQRRDFPGPEIDLDFHTYMTEQYFAQSFNEEA